MLACRLYSPYILAEPVDYILSAEPVDYIALTLPGRKMNILHGFFRLPFFAHWQVIFMHKSDRHKIKDVTSY